MKRIASVLVLLVGCVQPIQSESSPEWEYAVFFETNGQQHEAQLTIIPKGVEQVASPWGELVNAHRLTVLRGSTTVELYLDGDYRIVREDLSCEGTRQTCVDPYIDWSEFGSIAPLGIAWPLLENRTYFDGGPELGVVGKLWTRDGGMVWHAPIFPRDHDLKITMRGAMPEYIEAGSTGTVYQLTKEGAPWWAGRADTFAKFPKPPTAPMNPVVPDETWAGELGNGTTRAELRDFSEARLSRDIELACTLGISESVGFASHEGTVPILGDSSTYGLTVFWKSNQDTEIIHSVSEKHDFFGSEYQDRGFQDFGSVDRNCMHDLKHFFMGLSELKDLIRNVTIEDTQFVALMLHAGPPNARPSHAGTTYTVSADLHAGEGGASTEIINLRFYVATGYLEFWKFPPEDIIASPRAIELPWDPVPPEVIELAV